MDSKSLLFVPLLPGLFSKEIQGSIGVGGPTRSSFQGNSRKNGVVSLWVVGQLLLVHCSNKKNQPKKILEFCRARNLCGNLCLLLLASILPTSSQNHLLLIFMFWLVCVCVCVCVFPCSLLPMRDTSRDNWSFLSPYLLCFVSLDYFQRFFLFIYLFSAGQRKFKTNGMLLKNPV
jgi:hypothetical protein